MGPGRRGLRLRPARFLFCLLFATVWCNALPDTWAVLVCASRFWYNYRHVANTLSMYQLIRRLGVPDSHIILMLADDMACNARNPLPGTVYRGVGHEANLCDGSIEVDYKGAEVTVEAFVRVLMGRHDDSWPSSKRLSSTNESRILLYMTGHGGDGFLKFHNYEEIGSEDLAVAFEDMKGAGRFRELLFVVDTCQGGTLSKDFRTDGVLAVGSSARGENSYAHQNDMQVGVALVDRFTDSTCLQLHQAAGGPLGGPAGLAVQRMNRMSLERLLASYDVEHLRSTPVLKSDNFHRPLDQVAASDFFAQSDDSIERLSLRRRRDKLAALLRGEKDDRKLWRPYESERTRSGDGPSPEASHEAAGAWGLHILQLLMPDLDLDLTLADIVVRWVEGGISVVLVLALMGLMWSSEGRCGKRNALGLYGVVKAQHSREAHKLHEWEDEHGSTGAEDGTLRTRDSMQAMDWGPVSTPTSIDIAASHSHSHRHERLRTVESPPASSASVVEMAQRAPSGGKKDKQQSPAAMAVVVEGQRAGKEEDDERSQVTLRGAGDASVSSQGSGTSGTQWLCKGSRCVTSGVDFENAATQRLVAFGVGIVHDIAGPGGILGVLPAVQLHDWGKASVYLGTFCITSTLTLLTSVSYFVCSFGCMYCMPDSHI